MAQVNTTTTTVAAPKATAPAPTVAAPKATKAAPATLQAPRYVLGPWPVNQQGKGTIRAYMYAVAKALTKANPNGFTVAQYAAALVSQAAGTTYKQPGAGFAMVTTPSGASVPNGVAMAHANWPAKAAQGYLVLASAPATKAAPKG